MATLDSNLTVTSTSSSGTFQLSLHLNPPSHPGFEADFTVSVSHVHMADRSDSFGPIAIQTLSTALDGMTNQVKKWLRQVNRDYFQGQESMAMRELWKTALNNLR